MNLGKIKEIIVVSKKHGRKTIVVDDVDFDGVSKHNWSIVGSGSTFYALSNLPRSASQQKHFTIKMHRLISNAAKGTLVDHRDGNGLNNQRDNLRICTPFENACNRKKRKNSQSRFKGVYWNKQSCRFWSDINYRGNKIYIGMFDSEIEAALAYDRAAEKHHGEFARKNFQ
jgi:hypothetical protein